MTDRIDLDETITLGAVTATLLTANLVTAAIRLRESTVPNDQALAESLMDMRQRVLDAEARTVAQRAPIVDLLADDEPPGTWGPTADQEAAWDAREEDAREPFFTVVAEGYVTVDEEV